MAKELTPEEKEAQAEKKRLQEEKKKLKKEQAEAKKAAKQRAKEIAAQEEELDEDKEGGGFVTFLATLFIVCLWLAVVCVVIKLDVGGFGSSVLTPILKDVPVVNKILPGNGTSEVVDGSAYGGYTSLADAVNTIYSLELQVETLQTQNKNKDDRITELTSEITRLSEFEKMQVEFQRIRNEFYEEVIYAENGPGPEEYKKYYETMDPATAEFLYKQVVAQIEVDKKWDDYVLGYSNMKPKQAAAAFEEMADSQGIALVARILESMNAEDRAKIMDAMSSDFAARVTKIMDPQT